MKWSIVKLGEEVKIKGGGTPSRQRVEFYRGDIPWATVKDLTGFYLNHTQEHITSEALKSSAANLIPSGNVILATRVGLGKISINTVDTAINQDLKALFPSRRLDAKYLAYYLTSFAERIIDEGVGATVKGITLKNVESWPLPLPPLSEQRRIVEILDQADALRRKRAEADEKASRILQSIFLKMFGDPATNPKRWPIQTLGSLGRLDRGRSRHRPRNDPKLLGGPYPFIQTGDIANSDGYVETYTSTYSELGLAQSKMWPVETLCITIAANIAATAILRFEACFPDSVVGFTPGPNTNSPYIRLFLENFRPVLERMAPQLAQKNINLSILREIPVPAPPKTLQDQFRVYHDAFLDSNRMRMQTRHGLESLWKALLGRAFSGELTAKWREAHLKELLAEMEQQTKETVKTPI